jgi:hypothetical protein
MITFYRAHYSYYFWIGLNDLDTEATYKWTDGSNYYYANWNNREPNDYMRQENCIHLLRYNGKWNDQHCQYKYPFVCKAYNGVYDLLSPWENFTYHFTSEIMCGLEHFTFENTR